jgi:hypothetical protein
VAKTSAAYCGKHSGQILLKSQSFGRKEAQEAQKELGLSLRLLRFFAANSGLELGVNCETREGAENRID